MSRIITILVLLLMTINNETFGDDSTVVNINTFINIANEGITDSSTNEPFGQYLMNNQDNALDLITEKMQSLIKQIESLNSFTLSTESLEIELYENDDDRDGLAEIKSYTRQIESLYTSFTIYIRDLRNYNEKTINDFISVILSNEDDYLQDITRSIYQIIMPANSMSSGESLFDRVLQLFQESPVEKKCGNLVSVQQRLFEIYNYIAVITARGFIMTAFAYSMQSVNATESHDGDMKKAASALVVRVEEYLLALESALIGASRSYYNCNPSVYRRRKNFIELEGAIQMFVIAESDIVSDGSCTGECSDLVSNKIYRCYNYNNYCPSHKCYGHIYGCKSADSSKLCELPEESHKRYDWVRDKKSHLYGRDDTCSGSIKEANGWTRGFVYCDLCVCTCVQERAESTAIRTISLRPSLSNIIDNKVVTGVKFIVADQMIQFQVKESTLLPGGRVDYDSEKWVDREKFIYATDVSESGDFYVQTDDEKVLLKNGVDYSFIRSTQRIINLDNLEISDDYVVTGVRFQHEGTNVDYYGFNNEPLQLEIHVTKFDFTEGKLSADDADSYWLNVQNMPKRSSEYNRRRSEVELTNPDNPILLKAFPDSKPNQYIYFMESDRDKDAGQSTVPFFDSQPVISTPSVPLSGISLFHKGSKGSGGFIALKIISIDYSKHLNTTLDEESIGNYTADFTEPIPYTITRHYRNCD